jgi:hypothetical protein
MAMQNAELSDGEGNTYRLFDLLDFGGENKAVIITRQLARDALEAGCAGLVAENARLREALKTARPLVATYGDHPDATDAMVRASLRAAKQIDNVLNGEMK